MAGASATVARRTVMPSGERGEVAEKDTPLETSRGKAGGG